MSAFTANPPVPVAAPHPGSGPSTRGYWAGGALIALAVIGTILWAALASVVASQTHLSVRKDYVMRAIRRVLWNSYGKSTSSRQQLSPQPQPITRA